MIYSIMGEKMTAKIDSCGARLTSVLKNGTEYIWQRNPEYWSDCAPVLFPVIAKVKEDKISYDGKDYPMTKHGFVRNAEFDMIKQTKSMITLKYSDNPDTLKMYPWKFEFFVTFAIENDECLRVTFEVINRCEKEYMYFCLGGHPAINVPLKGGERFSDYIVEFEKPETLSTDYTNEDGSISSEKKTLVIENERIMHISREMFNNDAMIFEDVKSSYLELKNPISDMGVRFDFGDFPTLAIWSKGEPSDAPYICIEPWFGMGERDDEGTDIDKKFGVQSLKPEAEFVASFGITVL